ncbi:hypothetical protein [Nakamurella endophytica]|uniref:Exo-alpha-sialidase n=1 Tax=Nakamurella endophytica TaxID=1748367 RepID=A0A917WET6_9ACTN|nr:hypothetical protein [Nakamurella endophytica]GGL96380.1 hypothetical protein GCM10011594_15170 [Nakamurella endophytica]
MTATPPPARAVLDALSYARGRTVLVADEPGPGVWVGAPSVAVDGDRFLLAYRERRPGDRGQAVVVAGSTDGQRWTPLARLRREDHHCDSLERPCLVRTDAGRWRLYLSTATPGTRHWQVVAVEADSPADLPGAEPVVVLPGDPERLAVKDPVIRRDADGWHLWASCHPLEDPDATDRMRTDHFVSAGGLSWTARGTALAPAATGWDRRGVRFTAVLPVADGLLALYDGRADAAENFEERTGAALGAGAAATFERLAGRPVLVSPHGRGGLRYLDAVRGPDGALHVFYESSRDDGGHELRHQVLPGPGW